MDIFVNFQKKKHFLLLQNNNNFFSFHFVVLKEYDTFQSNSLFFFFFLEIALCNQPTVVLRHWKQYRTETFKPYFTPLWTIGFSTVTYIQLWWSVKDLQKNALKIQGRRSTVDILTSDKKLFIYLFIFFFFDFISPVLIDNPNNFEINRLIKLLVSRIFLLP